MPLYISLQMVKLQVVFALQMVDFLQVSYFAASGIDASDLLQVA